MKGEQPLDKLLRAAARAERQAGGAERPLAMPLGWEARVLAGARKPEGLFAFLPLFRGALAGATAIACLTAALHFTSNDGPDPMEITLNYSLAAAYLR